MNTDDKGDISEQYAVIACLVKGWKVSRPIGKYPYDFIADNTGILIRIQVKTAKELDGTIEVLTNSQKYGGKTRPASDEVDALMIYRPLTNKLYYLARNQFEGKTTVRLRLDPPKTDYPVRYAKDFEF